MYSQLDEDEIILKFYGDLKNKYPQFLSNKILDIGANDGETISNTRALIIKYSDITGYFIEPNPACYEKLSLLYPENHMLFNFAMGDIDGISKMYCNGSHLSPNDTGLLSTILEKETKRWGDEKWEIIDVPVKKYPFADINFDFISMDTEGMDEIILPQINLEKTWIVCIEWNSEPEREIFFSDYCKRYSLELIHKNSINLIYVKYPSC
jgi:FkbM family methyltransferase